MISFKGATPDWNNIPALTVKSVDDLIDGAKTLVMQTEAGPVHISLHSFGARLRFGQRQFGDYGMLVEEPKALPFSVAGTANTTV